MWRLVLSHLLSALVHLLDLVNVSEICRQSGLDSHDLHAEVDVSRLRDVFAQMFLQLNQRLPAKSRADVDLSTEWLLYWLLTAYDTVGVGMIRIFALKIALAVLCRGRITDKLTCKSERSFGLTEYAPMAVLSCRNNNIPTLINIPVSRLSELVDLCWTV